MEPFGPELHSPAAFRSHVLTRLVASLDEVQERNLDPSYPADGAVLGREAYVGKRAKFLEFLGHNFDALYETARLFEDLASRELFVDLLLFRALGHERVRLPSNVDLYWTAKSAAAALPSVPSRFNTLPGGKGLQQFSLAQEGGLLVDCLQANVFFTFLLRQYYFSIAGAAVQPEPGDVAIDAGACFGDTALAFARSVGPNGRVCAFEPVQTHLSVLAGNVAQNEIGNVLIYPAALGSVDQPGAPAASAIDPGYAGGGGETVRSLDGLVAEGTIGKVDFVKMDIEGHELAALHGAASTLRRFVPKLAISIYHRWEDYFQIPAFIRQLDLGYRMFLANYTVSAAETVLYCVRRPA